MAIPRSPAPPVTNLPPVGTPGRGALSGLPPIVFGLLTGMDKAGELILGTWLYGGGEDHDIVDDPFWTDYMMAHKDMGRQISDKLLRALLKILSVKKLGTFLISERFHAEFPENSGNSGYALLHGSNKTVGDFLMTGTAEVQEANEPAEGDYDIELDLRFRFNDIVDPNSNYAMDKIRSTIAKVVSFGRAKDYRLSINWSSSCLAEFRNRPGRSGGLYLEGYPSEYHRAIRPLPRARLAPDRAKDYDAKIISQLQRKISPRDIASLVDQKRRLLWLFYTISFGLLAEDYRKRLTAASRGDEMVRLLHERISREWRAEIMEALRGKRPPGIEPL
jgi:hypothetical protein